MIKLFTFVILYLLTFVIHAQHYIDYNVRNYNNERELEQNFIYDIVQKENGYLQISSEEGIFTYDGESFIKNKTIPQSIVTSLSFNTDGMLYAGSMNGEIYQPGFSDKWSTKSTGRIDNLTGIDGGFIFLEEHQNIVHISQTSKKTIYSAKSFIYEITHNKDTLCFIDNDSLINITINKNELRLKKSYNKSIKNCIYFKHKQWIGINNENKIQLLTLIDNRVTPIKTLENLPNNSEITTLSFHENTLWVGTKFQGLFKLTISDSRFGKLVRFTPKTIQGSIHKVIMDLEENIWVATSGGGLYQLIPTIFSYQNFTKKPVNIITNKDKTIVAFDDGFFVNPKEHSPPFSPSKTYFNSPYTISSIAFLNDNQLIIGTIKGAYVFDLSTGLFTLIDIHKDSYCYKVSVLTSGLIAISTLNNGLYLYNDKFKQTKHYCLNTGFLSNNILDFRENPSDHSLWLNLGIDGLAEINKKGILYWSKSKLLPKVKINDLCFKNENVFLATEGKGVLKINKKTKSVEQLSTDNELLSNFPTSISYINNTLWIGFNNGVQKINKHNHFDTYKKIDFAENTYIQKRGMYNVNDELILLGKKGIYFYNSNVDSIDKMVLKPQLIQLSINQENLDEPPKELDFNENNLSISFKSTNLKGKTIFYRYRLMDLEKEWNNSNVYPVLNYSNLAPGNYTFELQVSKDSYYNNFKKAGFSFSVTKPFWKKWWFMLTQILFLISVAFVLFFFAKESHSRKKIRFFAYVCVFILFEFVHELVEPYFIDSANEITIIKISLNLIIALSLYPAEAFIQRIFRKKT